MRARTFLGLALAANLFVACFAPPPPSVQATDAARELNVAARFGRLDVAASKASTGARHAFLERRAAWGRELRVLDTELAGLDMNEPTKATVYVDISWVRIDEDTLRVTRVAQSWQDQDGGW